MQAGSKWNLFVLEEEWSGVCEVLLSLMLTIMMMMMMMMMTMMLMMMIFDYWHALVQFGAQDMHEEMNAKFEHMEDFVKASDGVDHLRE